MFGRMQFIAKPSKKAIKRPHINFCNETEAKGSAWEAVRWSVLGLKLRALEGKGEMVSVGTRTTGSGRWSLLARD